MFLRVYIFFYLSSNTRVEGKIWVAANICINFVAPDILAKVGYLKLETVDEHSPGVGSKIEGENEVEETVV